ncbi:MAG: hypothetical protein JW811_05350 [Clostridiales bacterium]|nr:hypothetical protein [Clostridiales bacterium]
MSRFCKYILGALGCMHADAEGFFHFPAMQVETVDTTAAGDTFIGYYLAGVLSGHHARDALELANRTGAIAVARSGAANSIPTQDGPDMTRPQPLIPIKGCGFSIVWQMMYAEPEWLLMRKDRLEFRTSLSC